MGSLKEYQAKRHFNRTPEPNALPGAKTKPGGNLSFVVQEHHASHLHYDFRLEAQGVLKSWAIPKAPSSDPAIKRLAIEVEDHPISYGKFHGKIPKGEYGAGTVSIWDRGTYECEDFDRSLETGRIDFKLKGRKLKGDFQLRRMSESKGKPQWLFFRKNERAGLRTSNELNLKVDDRWIHLTHLDKVLYPQADFTKKQVLNYYRKVAPYLLPHLVGRPITLKRFPDGVEGESFYEKRCPHHRPEWFKVIGVRGIDFTAIGDLSSLLWVVNLASLELHPLLSQAPDIEEPRSVVFDLDPGEGVGMEACVTTALRLRNYLLKKNLKSLAKVSGSKGIQVYAPLNTACDFDLTKNFALKVAKDLSALHPKEILWQMPKALRKGKVMIDWSQNDRNKTTVSVYSLRAGAVPLVSFPIAWSDLEEASKTKDFASLKVTPKEAIERLEKNDDLFKEILTLKQKLPRK
jgi:DNA ligase D-like protein (predicted polymerase)/DNA ligase D-like protein (predicted 3'-phosphoesterase)